MKSSTVPEGDFSLSRLEENLTDKSKNISYLYDEKKYNIFEKTLTTTEKERSSDQIILNLESTFSLIEVIDQLSSYLYEKKKLIEKNILERLLKIMFNLYIIIANDQKQRRKEIKAKSKTSTVSDDYLLIFNIMHRKKITNDEDQPIKISEAKIIKQLGL